MVRLKDKEFRDQLKAHNWPCLFIDGSSKFNPGRVGVGGLILDHEGTKTMSYEWGLGNKKNNRKDAYGFLLGAQILYEFN